MAKPILIVDDNVDILEMLAEVLVMKGYQVITCNRSCNAMGKIKNHHPQLIILDIQMPGLTGRDLVLQLKEYDEKIPVIVLSAKIGMKDDIEFKLSKNVKVFLAKPCDLNEVIATVKRLLPRDLTPDKFVTGDYQAVLGQSIGNCRLKKLIGVGGTGIVYLGEHQTLKIPIAVKILSPIFYHDGETIRRFLREASILADMEHPNIVRILNADQQDGIYFLLMRYINGDSFYNFIRQQLKIDYLRAAKIILEVARGLAAAHNHSILHRDVKPSNILISQDESVVKIIDFGLARRAQKDERITERGVVLGTPGYMSPEQYLDDTLDERTDIYSLGATFYRAVTGLEPFEGPSVVKIMAQLQGEFLQPHLLDSSIPVAVSQIITKMIAKDRNDRYLNMNELIVDLERMIAP